MEASVVNPNIASSMILIKVDTFKLNLNLDYKLNKNFINGIKQIRKGLSWNTNQISLVAHGNRHHYKTIEKHTLERTRGKWRSSALKLMMLDSCLEPLAFSINKRVCKGMYL